MRKLAKQAVSTGVVPSRPEHQDNSFSFLLVMLPEILAGVANQKPL